MMTNLFSTFDPATSTNWSCNWMSTIMIILIIPTSFWFTNSRSMYLIKMITSNLFQEFSVLLKTNKKTAIMFMSLFMFIIVNNMMGLLPYIFTSSSHLIFTMTLALPLWLSIMIFGWTKNTNHMFAHLLPEGSPPILMPFMVCIETISNLIRPGSLAVRLTANMIAGHLLMSLLGSNITNKMIMVVMIIQIILMLFETAVSMIQAYVFSILSTLYTSEI